MTKVQIHFQLPQPLTDPQLARIADAHTVYGIQHVKVAPSLDRLTVEYDATRLCSADVEAALGISVTGYTTSKLS